MTTTRVHCFWHILCICVLLYKCAAQCACIWGKASIEYIRNVRLSQKRRQKSMNDDGASTPNQYYILLTKPSQHETSKIQARATNYGCSRVHGSFIRRETLAKRSADALMVFFLTRHYAIMKSIERYNYIYGRSMREDRSITVAAQHPKVRVYNLMAPRKSRSLSPRVFSLCCNIFSAVYT